MQVHSFSVVWMNFLLFVFIKGRSSNISVNKLHASQFYRLVCRGIHLKSFFPIHNSRTCGQLLSLFALCNSERGCYHGYHFREKVSYNRQTVVTRYVLPHVLDVMQHASDVGILTVNPHWNKELIHVCIKYL